MNPIPDIHRRVSHRARFASNAYQTRRAYPNSIVNWLCVPAPRCGRFAPVGSLPSGLGSAREPVGETLPDAILRDRASRRTSSCCNRV
ncbi:MAG: hypothetical protein A3G25_07695 [Betaproteobacteria bacterium RIFCSPLOWO2_12_FULL_63_13]|nr:MAG: hypothetical protein A3H32_19210 [Betaproteobacteria bacterium RIFCSPLOWO2_02_FULL_63_19]OGA53690.1 MAG: hypothetical protein A3G25_07695 [Betaproteobacteria bacterium RIFCSPLOWO2_12_FULL_63_13]